MATQVLNQLQQRRAKARPVEYKSLAVSAEGFIVSEDSRTISGYAAIFGNVDEAGDMILKGAFAKSIAERGPNSSANGKIILLWQHDMDEPLGKITKLKEDDKGLYFEAALDKITEADRALEQLQSGTLNQFSIGYKYVWDQCEWDSDLGCLIIKELRLFEVSVVSIACNGDTEFSGMKSQQLDSASNTHLREIEKAIKALPDAAAQYKFRQLFAKTMALAEARPLPAPDHQEPPKKSVFGSIGAKY